MNPKNEYDTRDFNSLEIGEVFKWISHFNCSPNGRYLYVFDKDEHSVSVAGAYGIVEDTMKFLNQLSTTRVAVYPNRRKNQ